MEDRFMAQCERDSQRLTDTEIGLSHKINFRALEIIDGDGKYVRAYAAAAALVVRVRMPAYFFCSTIKTLFSLVSSNCISLR
jgi:hypothetical protein